MKSNFKLNVLGVGSSMRIDSKSTAVLKLTLDIIKRNGAQTQLLDLRQTRLPFLYTAEDNNKAEKIIIEEITKLVRRADAFILATPDYHGSMSGGMKNFLDYFWSEFAGKLFGYICSSHEKGLTVMDQMRTAIRQCYGWSMPYNISIDGNTDFDSNGQIVVVNNNTALIKRVNMLARDLIVYGTSIRKQFNEDVLNHNLENTFAARYRNST